MEKTKKALTLHRTAFMRIYEKLVEEFSKENYDISEIHGNIKVMEDRMLQLSELNQLMIDLMLDSDVDEATMNAEVELMDTMRYQYHKMKFSFDSFICQGRGSKKSESKIKLRVPKPESRQFNGIQVSEGTESRLEQEELIEDFSTTVKRGDDEGYEVCMSLIEGDLPSSTNFDSDSSTGKENCETLIWKSEEMQRFSKPIHRYYISVEMNPTDLPSRDCYTQEVDGRWWEDLPRWLCDSMSQWSRQNFGIDEEEINSERMKVEGLNRLQTKIFERYDAKDFSMTFVLHTNYEVRTHLIFEEHIKICHVGVEVLMSILRENKKTCKGS